MSHTENEALSRGRPFAAVGALFAALAVAAAAYASHGLGGDAQRHLTQAAVFAFAHGVALLALANGACPRSRRWGMLALILGVLLFAGSLAGAALLHSSTRLAPAGGTLLILAWLYLALTLALPARRG